MIELNNSSLCFFFPQIGDTLRALVRDYITKTLPKILGEDRNVALDEAIKDGFMFWPRPNDLQDMRHCTHRLSEKEIADAFRNKVGAIADGLLGLENRGRMQIDFQRTLRIPDDGNDYPLPPGLGKFPLRHVDDFASRVPTTWLDQGGVFLPMYQAEALWIKLTSIYPFAVKVASGKINAITGQAWRAGLNRGPQDYLVLPEQPWLDGFAVEKGFIRQFVAMPLGAGYSVEEQLTSKANFGGIQLQVYPMRAEVYFRDEIRPELPKRLADLLPGLLPRPKSAEPPLEAPFCVASVREMGLGAGGRMRQEIYEDPHDFGVWNLNESSRCFVHLCDALVWREITGTNPPHPPFTAKEYERAGLPWFDFYRDDIAVLEGSKKLADVKSVATLSKQKGDQAIADNSSVGVSAVVNCGPDKRPNQVREWTGA